MSDPEPSMVMPAIQSKTLLGLIGDVYDAAVDGARWAALAPQIARAFDSTSAAVTMLQKDRPRVLTMTDNVSAGLSAYNAHFWKRDVWIQRGNKLAMPVVGASHDLVTDAEFEETEFYRDWLRHQDVFHMVGAVFRTGHDEVGILSMHRPRVAGTYAEEEKAIVSRFFPHVQRALQIRNRLAHTDFLQRVSLETLTRTDTAALVVDADGRIIFANPHAERLLSSPSAICVRNGQLTTRLPADSARLLSLIRSASNMGEASNTPGGVMTLRQAKDLPLTALIAPFRLAIPGLATPRAIVFIRDPNRSISATSALRSLFQLTPAEARIAQELSNGKSLAEIAALHRASQQTVRKQLKAIFAKTGTNRQAQCVAAILRSVAAIARD